MSFVLDLASFRRFAGPSPDPSGHLQIGRLATLCGQPLLPLRNTRVSSAPTTTQPSVSNQPSSSPPPRPPLAASRPTTSTLPLAPQPSPSPRHPQHVTRPKRLAVCSSTLVDREDQDGTLSSGWDGQTTSRGDTTSSVRSPSSSTSSPLSFIQSNVVCCAA